MALHFDGFHGRFSNITAAEGSGGADACDGPKSATKAAEKVDAVNSSSLEDSLRDLLSDDEADEMPCEADRHSAEAKPAAVSLQVSVATPAAATPRRMFRTDSSLSNMSCATDDATPPNSARPVRALGARKGFEGNFKWGSLPDELVVQVAMRLAWPMVGQVCMSVCRRWHHTLRGDVLWNFFSRQHWTPEACTHRHLEELDHTGGWMAFRDWHRRRVWRVYGELQTGWDWLLARLSQASLSGEEQARCRQVTRPPSLVTRAAQAR